HHVGALPDPRDPSDFLCSLLEDVDPRFAAQLSHGVAQERSSPGHSLDERQVSGRPASGEHQPRNSPARPEINDRARRRPGTGPAAADEAPGVLEGRPAGPRTQNASLTGDLEDRLEGCEWIDPAHAGRITPRRRGSSPSDSVATPSISAT